MQMLPSDGSRRRGGWWLLFGLLAVAAPLRAATPRDELLRLVPDSIGFCLLVQDLRDHAASLHDSPFDEQLRRSPLMDKLRKSDEVKKLHKFEAKLKDKLGLDWAHLRDDILGDAVVFAYRPGPPGKPEREQGIILIRARDAKILADLIERLNKVQKDEGELKELEERRHNEVVYYRRVERDKPPTFYFVHGPIVALSGQEEMLRQAIDCDRARSADAVPDVTRRLRELDAERALFAVWLNPRAFDAEVDSKAASAPAERVAPAKHFAVYWKALDSVVLSLSPAERDINLSVGLRGRVAELPAAQRLFREASAPSELWRRFPETALLAVSGRFDGAALCDVLGGFLTPRSRQALRADLNRQIGVLLGTDDFAKDVLPALGPDWGLCVTAPAARDKGWMPQMLFALRVDSSRTKKPLERKLLDMLDSATRLFVFGYNRQHPERTMTPKTIEVDKQEVHYLASEGGLPVGVQPAYGLLNGYLVFSTSLERINRFAQTPASSAPAADATPLVRISVKNWRTYLNERREPIMRFFADKNRLSSDEAAQQLDRLLANLQFVDRLELRQRTAPGQVVFTLAVRTAQPLKK